MSVESVAPPPPSTPPPAAPPEAETLAQAKAVVAEAEYASAPNGSKGEWDLQSHANPELWKKQQAEK